MTTNQFFLEATQYFYKNQYEKGLEKVNKCIQFHPNSSTLLANRALFYSQMGHLQKAIQELEYCIRLDYQNYIPYFNLFSLKVRKNDLEQALKDLCCSLSCLYLTRARFRKRQQDTKQAIKYAKNNVQAHVLRGLMFLQSKKVRECLNELDWAFELNSQCSTLNKIRGIVQKKLGIRAEMQALIVNKTSIQRLQSSYQSIEQDLMMQIKMKMTQFNGIYNDLNEQNGIVTHRVPRTLLPHQIQKLLLNSQQNEQIRQLYELKYNSENANEPVIYQMKEEYRIQNQIQFEQKLKDNEEDQGPSELSSRQEQLNEDELNNDSLMDRVEFEDQQEISKIAENQQQFMEQELQNNQLSVSVGQEQGEHSYQEYLVVDEYPEFPQQEPTQSKIQPSFSVITQQKQSPSEYLSSSISSKDIQEIVNLYPMQQHKRVYGRFKIQTFQILDEKLINNFFQDKQDSTEILNNRQMYCVCTYFKQKPGYKVTTCDRALFFNSSTKKLQCKWGETFKSVMLVRQNAQSTYVKIYAKNYNSYNDDLIGTGSKIIETNGDIHIPILSVKTSQQIGVLSIKLYLIDK